MKRIPTLILTVFLISLISSFAIAQEEKTFTNIKVLPHTGVKNQGASGTCWSYCTISLLESELMRQGKGSYELSEMFTVYHCYIERAVLYLRTGGNNNFSQGGIDNDVFWVIRNFGLVRDEDYDGLWPGEDFINHSEMARSLTGFLKGVTSGKYPSAKWEKGFTAVLDTYMTKPPEKIIVDGMEMTPVEFASSHLGIKPEDYVGITSFLHMPYYEQSELYLPDNWMHHSDFYNVKLDEFMAIIRNAVERGFTVSIGADVSEDTWHSKEGYAVYKEGETVTAEEREEMWDNWRTTDDHGMHVVGIAEDEDGNLFYYTKNSWSEQHGPYNGYDYISENYIRAKVNAITIHKDALSQEMKDKLGIR